MAMVMIVIVVLGILAGGFAYSMKVETKLARNSSFEGDMEWIARSGAELARYVLYQSSLVTSEPWESLNQKWAGGPMGTNDILNSLSLEDNEVGPGKFSIKITDLERRFNINMVNDGTIQVLHQALELVGVDPVDRPLIADSFLDWIDPNDDSRLNGAESSDYIRNPNPGYPPYVAKNGPLGDISELLLVRGVTPEIYWGPGFEDRSNDRGRSAGQMNTLYTDNQSGGPVGLADVFTTLSSARININTAPAQVLELLPGMDSGLAQAIIMTRAGLDGMDGTDDDVPFRSVGELINVPGMPPPIIPTLQQLCHTRSLTFQVDIEAEIDGYKRQYVAVLRRNPGNPRDIQIIYFQWR